MWCVCVVVVVFSCWLLAMSLAEFDDVTISVFFFLKKRTLTSEFKLAAVGVSAGFKLW
jgi:hypothetical protein